MSSYICENCKSELKPATFYKHSRHCYDLHLAICITCSEKKLFTKPEVELHSTHVTKQVRSSEQQKEIINTLVNPMKKRKRFDYEENETKIIELQNTLRSSQAEIEQIDKLKLEVDNLRTRLQEKVECTEMLKAALERTKMERDEMELYATSNRNIVQETLKKLHNAEAQLKSANLDYRFVRIDFLVKSNLSCIYLAKIETKTETKRVIIKQFLSDSDRKEELAIQTSLNSLPCVRQYLPHFEFLSMPGSMVFAYYNGTLSNIREQAILNDSDKFIKTIVKQAFEALHKIHDRRVLHLDVKPNNFLFVWDDKNDTLQVVIGDFGLSKQLPENTSTRQTATIKTTRAGTSYYRAPEIYKLVACKASDIYSMAVALLVIFSKNQDTLKHLDKQLQQTKSKVTKSSNTSEQTSSKKSIIERPAKSAQVVLNQIPPEMIVPAWSAFFQHLKPMLNNMLAENINHRPSIPEIIQHIDLFETKQ